MPARRAEYEGDSAAVNITFRVSMLEHLAIA